MTKKSQKRTIDRPYQKKLGLYQKILLRNPEFHLQPSLFISIGDEVKFILRSKIIKQTIRSVTKYKYEQLFEGRGITRFPELKKIASKYSFDRSEFR